MPGSPQDPAVSPAGTGDKGLKNRTTEVTPNQLHLLQTHSSTQKHFSIVTFINNLRKEKKKKSAQQSSVGRVFASTLWAAIKNKKKKKKMSDTNSSGRDASV